eukprot:4460122-Amphidinium_carterae.1
MNSTCQGEIVTVPKRLCEQQDACNSDKCRSVLVDIECEEENMGILCSTVPTACLLCAKDLALAKYGAVPRLGDSNARL